MIADALTSVGLQVDVVDRRGPAEGSTAASTALVQYEIDTPLTILTRKIGKERATRAWRRSRLAVEAIAARLGELGAPEFTRRDSLYLSGDVLNRADLAREHEVRRAAGLPGRFLDRTALGTQFGISSAAAILSYGNLVLDPRKTAHALLNVALANDTRLFAPVEIVKVTPHRGYVVATDSHGCIIRCKHLVFATGYEVPHDVPRRHHKIASTWAMATVRQQRTALWPGECCIWEAADPYIYIRTTSDHRVVCGGEDEDITDATARDALLARKVAVLQRKLHRLLPKLNTTPEFAWAGTFGETTTGLPIIGEIPGMPRCWVALGYGGNGTTYAAIAADIITGAIVGRPDSDADLYSFPSHRAAV